MYTQIQSKSRSHLYFAHYPSLPPYSMFAPYSVHYIFYTILYKAYNVFVDVVVVVVTTHKHNYTIHIVQDAFLAKQWANNIRIWTVD